MQHWLTSQPSHEHLEVHQALAVVSWPISIENLLHSPYKFSTTQAVLCPTSKEERRLASNKPVGSLKDWSIDAALSQPPLVLLPADCSEEPSAETVRCFLREPFLEKQVKDWSFPQDAAARNPTPPRPTILLMTAL